MTLTLKTAKHIINSHGEVFAIVETRNGSTDTVMTREQAETIAAYNPNFKPCVVVTTAREALEAAWELAHETREIPAHAPNIFRASDTNIQVSNGEPGDLYAGHGRLRLIDPPAPELEPWELSRYCYAGGEIYRRSYFIGEIYWLRPGNETHYSREDLAKLNPEPVTIEGDAE